jgi:hypothetical protein
MDERERALGLVKSALSVFHTVCFVAALAIWLQWSGSLERASWQLSPIVTIPLYGVLWYCTNRCTDRALHGLVWADLDERLDFGTLLVPGTIWGGVNGLLFGGVLVGAYLGLASLDTLVTGDATELVGLVLLVIVSLPIVWFFPFAAGALLGFAIALVDGWLFEASRLLLGAYEVTPDQPPNHQSRAD